ncbi:membrane protein BRI3 isoform X1 [Bos taurus]|uniref:membrane protein BRI3 isoform X1 n=1 Tax=Bos taurus TaxID=9913 RepID=UPI000D532E0A|nr:membrane protein BRI3 isoform X1 [Bos taurus]
MPPRPTLPHSSRPSARNGPGPGAFCVPHSCRPQPPALFYWSVRALFLAPSAGSLLPPRGPLLKPAMSTVQAAGIPTHHPRVYNIHSRNVTRYPANSIVVVGGCPVCSPPTWPFCAGSLAGICRSHTPVIP